MRDSLFKKAIKILSEGRMKDVQETENGITCKIVPSKYKVDEELLPEEYYEVIVKYENYALNHFCTCKNMSSSHPTNLCSHKIALMNWKLYQNALLWMAQDWQKGWDTGFKAGRVEK